MFKIEEVEEFYSNAVLPRFGESHRANIDKELAQLRVSNRRLAKKHLLPWIVLIDEGIHFLTFLGMLFASREEKKGIVQFTLTSLIAKLRSLAISFRELIILGQSDSSRLILRGFLETSELTLAAMSDEGFCKKYAPDSKTLDKYDYEFWQKHIAYGKIYIVFKDALERAGYTETEVLELIEWKKGIKAFLSGAVHTDSASAYQSCMVPSLVKPGTLYYFSLGSLSAYTPLLCNELIRDFVILSGTFKGLINSSSMPKHLKGFSVGSEYSSTISSCETIHNFYYKYYEELYIPIEELFPEE